MGADLGDKPQQQTEGPVPEGEWREERGTLGPEAPEMSDSEIQKGEWRG